jgi:hypothetical protein
MDEPRTVCRSPTPGAQPTRIPSWKFTCVREAILAAVPPELPGMPAKDLYEEVRRRLAREELDRLGALRWHVTTVKLELEVAGEIARVPGVRPQHLVRRGRGSRA